MLVTQGASH